MNEKRSKCQTGDKIPLKKHLQPQFGVINFTGARWQSKKKTRARRSVAAFDISVDSRVSRFAFKSCAFSKCRLSNSFSPASVIRFTEYKSSRREESKPGPVCMWRVSISKAVNV